MMTVAQVAERVGAAERSVRLWASQGKFRGAELVEPPAGVSYWLIPETALKGFEKRGRGRPPKLTTTKTRERNESS
ncbi:MAG TPA: hypothetical protein VJX67_09010 [Blastocatellia bacterium]|nr:hypothetical protein [Blastocatellia bacterium]